MGIIISRFRRKKAIGETLSELDGKLRSMEQYGRSTEMARRRVVANLTLTSVGLYVLVAIIFFFYCRPVNWREGFLYSLPLLISPILIVLLRKVIARYYDWKLGRNRRKLLAMQSEKNRILEEVMDKETYKVAKELLKKYGPAEMERPQIQFNNSILATPTKAMVPFMNSSSSMNSSSTPSQLRQRQVNQSMALATPQRMALGPVSPNQITPLQGNQLPRPIMSGNNGAFDRLVDYLIGDGPGSRYALICSKCTGHNGMAMPEEFEYVSYMCAYCRHRNMARKTRPRTPHLLTGPLQLDTSDHKSSSEENDESSDEKSTVKSEVSIPKCWELEEPPPSADEARADSPMDIDDDKSADGEKSVEDIKPAEEDKSVEAAIDSQSDSPTDDKKQD